MPHVYAKFALCLKMSAPTFAAEWPKMVIGIEKNSLYMTPLNTENTAISRMMYRPLGMDGVQATRLCTSALMRACEPSHMAWKNKR